MVKFIAIAFGFLGLAFYELSGGSDFDGEALRLSRVEVGTVKQGLPKIADAAKDIGSDDAEFEVSRAALNLVSEEKSKIIASVVTLAQPEKIEATPASLVVDVVEEPLGELILPSLIVEPEAFEVITSTSIQDVRIVSGDRVNVRSGPSTDYEVVGRLTRGVEVEVLDDNGDGWIEMRSLDGVTFGWMADFLLSDS
ncbi:SH3 domain-containing protein [Ascidiaceihabitans sp.]|nr:SH3 domain-containing protein [Paracoccaceae bacterium]MDA9351817.1 SH3 domain-containing protein [Ascidiaceihabitans sp.]MDB9945561.1 SH3 domain-containing protein [Ascidiaceihabitans sp.]HCI07612.1 hypothetical protein [Sulfitobacter sp.]